MRRLGRSRKGRRWPSLSQPSAPPSCSSLILVSIPSLVGLLSTTFPLGRLSEPRFKNLSTESLCLSYFCLWDYFVMSVPLHTSHKM